MSKNVPVNFPEQAFLSFAGGEIIQDEALRAAIRGQHKVYSRLGAKCPIFTNATPASTPASIFLRPDPLDALTGVIRVTRLLELGGGLNDEHGIEVHVWASNAVVRTTFTAADTNVVLGTSDTTHAATGDWQIASISLTQAQAGRGGIVGTPRAIAIDLQMQVDSPGVARLYAAYAREKIALASELPLGAAPGSGPSLGAYSTLALGHITAGGGGYLYLFDDDLTDSSGNGHTATQGTPAATFGAAMISEGKRIQLPGVGDEVFTAESADMAPGTGDWSLVIWVENIGSSEVMWETDSGASKRSYLWRTGPNIQLVTNTGSINVSVSGGGTTVGDGSAHMVCITHTASTGVTTLSIDAGTRSTDTNTAGLNSLTDEATCRHVIGNRYNGDSGFDTNGDIGPVFFVKGKALTPAEELALFNAG